MYDQDYLNINTSWKNLPWKKILFRILIIQKKIFQATKQYNLKKIYILQKYLLNSNEVKILSIENILNHSYFYCNIYGKKKYNITDEVKFNIFKYLFNIQTIKKTKFYLMIEQIKQYIIYLCIKPEWDAKFTYYWNNYQISNRYHSIKYILNNPFNLKYIFTKYLVNKMQALSYIHYSIKYWLNNNYCINLLKTFSLLHSNKNIIIYLNHQITIKLQFFYNLIYDIYLIGIDWYIFYERINYLNNIKTYHINYSENLVEDFSKSLITTIKFNLYKKNSLNKFKIYQLFNKYLLLNQLDNIIKIYLSYYLSYLTLRNIEVVYAKLNQLLYYWFKKQNKAVFFKKNQIIRNNYYLNKYLYHQINEFYYINY